MSQTKLQPIKMIVPICIFICVGMLILIISQYMASSDEFSICKFDQSNYRSNLYDSPQAERTDCLQAFEHVRWMFILGAFGLGIFYGVMRMYAFKDDEGSQSHDSVKRES